MTGGPYLYDEGPEALHTGTPGRRRGVIVGIVGGTAAVAVAMAVLLPRVTGTAEEQSRDVATVFVAALQDDDTETAHQLLCERERDRLTVGEVVDEYRRPGTGRVVDTSRAEVDGGRVQQVQVRWADGGAAVTTVLTVVNESGPRICGVTSPE